MMQVQFQRFPPLCIELFLSIISNIFEMSIYLFYSKDMKNNQKVTEIFKVLQDPIRIRIIEMLRFDHAQRTFLPETAQAAEGFCPMDILTILKEEGYSISNTSLSYHLKELKEHHIIHLIREGKRIFYVLNMKSLKPALTWVNRVLTE